MQEHRVVLSICDGHSILSPQKVHVVEAVLENLWNRRPKDFANPSPGGDFGIQGWPITISLFAEIPERDNHRHVTRGRETYAGDRALKGFNVNTEELGFGNELLKEPIEFGKTRLHVNDPLGSANFWKLAFAFCLHQVQYYYVSLVEAAL